MTMRQKLEIVSQKNAINTVVQKTETSYLDWIYALKILKYSKWVLK